MRTERLSSTTDRLLAAAAICLLLVAAGPAMAVRPVALMAGFSRGTVILDAGSQRCLRIESYFADAPQQQAQGLMFVEQMDEFEGMLFRYPGEAVINMWMKNTLIPLDMVFIAADGRIAHIAERTTPMSTQRISSGSAVTGVLELNAGFSARWHLATGDRLLLVD